MINLMSYIDPGTTALIWQIVAGVLIAMGVVIGIWWRKVKTFFKSVWVKIFGKKKNVDETDSAEDEIKDEISETEKESDEQSGESKIIEDTTKEEEL